MVEYAWFHLFFYTFLSIGAWTYKGDIGEEKVLDMLNIWIFKAIVFPFLEVLIGYSWIACCVLPRAFSLTFSPR
jgi:hypothetical protein